MKVYVVYQFGGVTCYSNKGYAQLSCMFFELFMNSGLGKEASNISF